jgi:hypothetical protein
MHRQLGQLLENMELGTRPFIHRSTSCQCYLYYHVCIDERQSAGCMAIDQRTVYSFIRFIPQLHPDRYSSISLTVARLMVSFDCLQLRIYCLFCVRCPCVLLQFRS